MKVLWFTGTPSLYNNKSNHQYFGCGWIESLQKVMETDNNVELAVAFFHKDQVFKSRQGTTIYYPINIRAGYFNKIKNFFFLKHADRKELKCFQQIIKDFNPDVIHVFGSENSYGLLCNNVKIPIVLHIQGLLNPCFNSFFIPGMSRIDYLLRNNSGIFSIVKNYQTLRLWKHACDREKIILSSCKYFLGRTNWDKELSLLYSTTSRYFYCSEILREEFYKKNWKKDKSTRFVITTTISKSTYKGFDIVLKTAKLLKELTEIDFEWRVFGIGSYDFMEKKMKIDAKSVNVKYYGGLLPEKLCAELIHADVFIHTSYIDNSPNSVCEAQLLGMPVISTNVGGIASLIEHEKDGLLVPANDPWILCSCIKKIFNNSEYTRELGVKARQTALYRHDIEKIFIDLKKAYSLILEEQ